VGGTKADAEYLANRFPASGGEVIPATPEDEALIRDLLRARADVRTAEEDQRLAENRIKERIAERGGIAGAAGVVTWKQSTRNTVDWRAVAHEWRNLLGLYVPTEAWERLTGEANAVVGQQTKTTTYRTLRVRGEEDTDA
jgi:predicted phage-related endonuclease